MTDRDPESPRDRALILGEVSSESGETKGVAVLRQRSEGAAVEAGILRAPREGEAIMGELLALKPTSPSSRVCDVEVLAKPAGGPTSESPRPMADAHKGPARVATDRYRDGWDAIFGDGLARKDRSALN